MSMTPQVAPARRIAPSVFGFSIENAVPAPFMDSSTTNGLDPTPGVSPGDAKCDETIASVAQQYEIRDFDDLFGHDSGGLFLLRRNKLHAEWDCLHACQHQGPDEPHHRGERHSPDHTQLRHHA